MEPRRTRMRAWSPAPAARARINRFPIQPFAECRQWTPAMATETELKLIAAARELQALPRRPWLREMAAGRAKKEKLVSLYFDTPDAKLHRQGVALRIRLQSGQRIQ